MANHKSAIKKITRFISPETLILIETTVPPGSCEKIIAPYLYKENGYELEDLINFSSKLF